MIFSNEFIEDVRTRNDIVDVISGYIQIQHKGSTYKGLCPFHSEKTPSFSVHRGRQMYHCFGCGKSGDVFNFVMEYDRATFSEAVESLARRAGMDIPESAVKKADSAEKSLKDTLLEINKEAAKYYYVNLHSKVGQGALAYLKGRGLTDDVIKSFGLGYSDRTGKGLYNYLKSKGYTDALLKESGIFSIDEKSGWVKDKFWNRVMFPIMDQNRKVIGFGGRVMGDAQPKYLNSPETKIFEKSRNLYGLYAAKQSRKNYMIICEGYMDVIALHASGYTNAVASLGTALTSQQSALIHRYVKDALLMYDSDGAGIKAARRAVPLLRDAGINPKVVDLSPYKDPDEFIKALGNDEMDKRIEAAENGFLFEIRQLQKEYDTNDPQGRADFLNKTAEKLLDFSDEIERSSYIESISRTYNVSLDLLKKQVAKLSMKGKPVKRETVEEPPVKRKEKDSPAIKVEKMMLSWMSKDVELTKSLAAYITEYDFSTDLNITICRSLFEQANSGMFNPVAILNQFEEADEKSDAAAILEGSEIPKDKQDRDTAVLEVLTAIKNQTYNRSLQQMNLSDPDDMQRFVEEKRKLFELKQGLFSIGGEN